MADTKQERKEAIHELSLSDVDSDISWFSPRTGSPSAVRKWSVSSVRLQSTWFFQKGSASCAIYSKGVEELLECVAVAGLLRTLVFVHSFFFHWWMHFPKRTGCSSQSQISEARFSKVPPVRCRSNLKLKQLSIEQSVSWKFRKQRRRNDWFVVFQFPRKDAFFLCKMLVNMSIQLAISLRISQFICRNKKIRTF